MCYFTKRGRHPSGGGKSGGTGVCVVAKEALPLYMLVLSFFFLPFCCKQRSLCTHLTFSFIYFFQHSGKMWWKQDNRDAELFFLSSPVTLFDVKIVLGSQITKIMPGQRNGLMNQFENVTFPVNNAWSEIWACVCSADKLFVAKLIVAALVFHFHMHPGKKAVSVCSHCMFSLLPTQVCERRLCLRLVCVAVECVCQLVRRPDTLRKWWGQGGRPPHLYPTHTHTKKRGFIATSLGQRASGLSFPHRTIISYSPTTEKYGLET